MSEILETKPIIIKNIIHFNHPEYWLGYKFIMSDVSKNIVCKIENSQNCCESFGVYTKSVIDDFIGAEYYSVDIGKICCKKSGCGDYSKTIGVTVNTSKGKFIILLYNEHNGYYRHSVFIRTETTTKKIYL